MIILYQFTKPDQINEVKIYKTKLFIILYCVFRVADIIIYLNVLHLVNLNLIITINELQFNRVNIIQLTCIVKLYHLFIYSYHF